MFIETIICSFSINDNPNTKLKLKEPIEFFHNTVLEIPQKCKMIGPGIIRSQMNHDPSNLSGHEFTKSLICNEVEILSKTCIFREKQSCILMGWSS